MGRTACTEPQCLYKGALYFCFMLHVTVYKGPSSGIQTKEVQHKTFRTETCSSIQCDILTNI